MLRALPCEDDHGDAEAPKEPLQRSAWNCRLLGDDHPLHDDYDKDTVAWVQRLAKGLDAPTCVCGSWLKMR